MTLTLVSDGDQTENEEKPASLLDDPKIITEMQEFVDDQAPRLFAVVRETRVPEDLKIVAWGMTTRKGAEVFPVEGGLRMSVQSAESALFFFNAGGRALARVFWVGGERVE